MHILAAEGKYAEAGKLYRALETSGNPEHSLAARFGRGAVALKTGDLKEAEAIFSGFLKADVPLDPQEAAYQNSARRELIYTLIRQNRIDDVRRQLAAVPESQRNVNYDILQALADVASGDLKKFKNNWQTIVQRQLRQPDARSYELLNSAAALAEKQNEPALSIELLENAGNFAPTAALKQDVFKRMINLQSKADPEGAITTARKYWESFPQSKDRFSIALSAARIAANAKKFLAAEALFNGLTDAKDIPQEIRFSAASDGALFAEQSGDFALAAGFYQKMVKFAATPDVSRSSNRKYADFLMRRHDYRAAAAVLEKSLDSAATVENQNHRYQLLDAAVMAGDSRLIRSMSEQLISSKNLLFRGRAHYELGELASENNDFAAARKEFLTAAAIKEAGKYAVAGQFGAALMAFKLGDYRNTGAECVKLAAEHPEMPQAHQAIFLGYQAARQLNDDKLKKECAAMLAGKYEKSESYAVYALQNAADRANSDRDFSGAIADLEELERNFANTPAILTESMLMRAGMLKNSGKLRGAMECITALLTKYPGCRAAYNAAMLGGEISFSGRDFPGALKFFQQAAALRDAGLERELADAGKIEVMLRLSVSNPKSASEAVAAAEKFINEVKFAPLRLKIRYYRAWALEHCGKNIEALAGYEQVINEAGLYAAAGSPFDINYCVKSAAAAMQIINSANRRSLCNRGLRLLRECRKLDLDRYGLNTGLLQNELIKKLSPQKTRR